MCSVWDCRPLLVSVIFQNIGLSYIIGAFFAGLIVHDGLIGQKAHSRITETLAHINRIFFIPLFFGIAGLEVNLWQVGASEYAVLALIIIVAFAAGVYATYYLCKRCLRRSSNLMPRQVAAILGGRGAIGIVIATVAFQGGVLGEAGFSLVIVATLVMSLIIPFLTGDMRGIDLSGSGGKSEKK